MTKDINIDPDGLSKGGGSLQKLGTELENGGGKLAQAGQRIAQHAAQDKSGLGKVFSEFFGRATQIAGDVIKEGGRVVRKSGQHLHETGQTHRENDRNSRARFEKLHPDAKTPNPKGGTGSPSRKLPKPGTPEYDARQADLRHRLGNPDPDNHRLRGPFHPVPPSKGVPSNLEPAKSIVGGADPYAGHGHDAWVQQWTKDKDLSRTRHDIDWPPDNGFAATPPKRAEWLEPGHRIDRFGPESGKFLSPEGAPWPNRALPDYTLNTGYHSYEVVKPIPVWAGDVAPHFYQPGGAIQYQPRHSVQELLNYGYLREV